MRRAQGNAVVAALAGLFRRFEAEGNGQQAPGGRAVVAPTALREALHALDAAAFSLGEMSDAAEVLTALYDSLRKVRARTPASSDPPSSLPSRDVAHSDLCRRFGPQLLPVQSVLSLCWWRGPPLLVVSTLSLS